MTSATFPTAVAAPERLRAPDGARGLALVCMVIIHTAFYAKVNIFAETYVERRAPLPGFGWTVTGLVLEFAPVLFWFLLGVSVALIGRRRANDREVDQFLLIRALVLLILDRTAVSFLWAPNAPFHVTTGFELLSCLALSLVLLVPVRRLPQSALAVLVAVLALGYPALIGNVSQARLESLPEWLQVFTTYDFNRVPMVTFPLAGWFVLPAFGLLLGRQLEDPAWRQPSPWVRVAVGCLVVALVSRLTGFGDYDPWNSHAGPLRFFVLSKGPPGLDYLGFYLGIGLLMFAALLSSRIRWERPPARWLVLYGQVSLFLYVAHLAVAWACARLMLHLLRHADVPRYALTCALTLIVLAPLAAAYRATKRRWPRSLLRYL